MDRHDRIGVIFNTRVGSGRRLETRDGQPNRRKKLVTGDDFRGNDPVSSFRKEFAV